MEPIKISEILKSTNGNLIKGNNSYLVKNISIDSRKIYQDDLFIAIKGKTLDGHKFIEEAINKGATSIIVHEQYQENKAINQILVKDTIKAFGDIALYYRKKFSTVVIGITGSNGKTTTKDMVAEILQKKLKIIKAPYSFNNDIGVPLTVLQLTKETQAMIIEMEMNEIGGTRRLCDIAQPSIGVITNIGDTHLEFMHNRDGVAQEKAELLEAISSYGIAILNADDPMVMDIGEKYKFKSKITYGRKNKVNFFASQIVNKNEHGCEFLLNNADKVKLSTPGIYNIYNALAAICVAQTMDISIHDIIATLETFQMTSMRMEKLNINGLEIINDAYNANPQSMMASLETFITFPSSGRKVVILGDMLELGEQSPELHKNLGKNLPNSIDILVTVGEQAKYIAIGAQEKGKKLDMILTFENPTQAGNKLVDIIKITDKILIKGSRAVKMEEIINKFKEYYDNKSKTG
jgi:UDP-N-acetylmuramoyl-tripeptide--D-alanyl-D-alanine ligase